MLIRLKYASVERLWYREERLFFVKKKEKEKKNEILNAVGVEAFVSTENIRRVI